MDTKRLVLAMTLSLAVMFAYQIILAKFYPPKPVQATATQVAATQAAATQTSDAQAPVAMAEMAPGTAPASSPTSTWHVQGADALHQMVLGVDTPAVSPDTFFTQAILTNRGAAIEQVLLVERTNTRKGFPYKYAKTVEGEQPYAPLQPLKIPSGEVEYSWATASIRVGQPQVTVPLRDVLWNHEVRQTPRGAFEAKFWVDVLNGQTPVVRITKRFVLNPQSYAIAMGLSLESLSGQTEQVVVDQSGPVGIPSEDLRSDFRKVFVVNAEKNRPVPTKWTHAQLVKNEAPVVIGSANPIMWLALVDKYFTAITAPVAATGAPSPIADVRISTYSRDPKAAGDIAMDLISPLLEVKAGAAATLQYDLYTGPKDPHIFTDNEQYLARGYNLMNSAEYAWCTFSSLGELMTGLLHWLNRWIWPHNYGLAIVILVLLVRVILHPLTKHQQVTMTKMQQRQAEVAPKIEAIKQRFAKDRQQIQTETMRVYREAGINPASQAAGCLPMLIQMPIWIALYSALNYDINLRHAPFVLWIRDLSTPDAFMHWDKAVNIPLISWFIGDVTNLNLLPVLLAVAMFLQQKFTPKPKPAAGASPEQLAQQQQMQKMMGFMMIFMGLLFYNMPSGLCLYIMASSTFGILEQYRIRQHIEKQRNLPVTQKASWRLPFVDKIMEAMEKKAKQSHTLRKEK